MDGVPSLRARGMPYIVDPISYPSSPVSRVASPPADPGVEKASRLHPYHQACLWQQEMDSNPAMTKAKIATREGLSRARVTQIMNLLELPEGIQAFLRDPSAPVQIQAFSERRLRQILARHDRESQLRQWQDLVHECQILVRKCTKIARFTLDCSRNSSLCTLHLKFILVLLYG